MLTALIARADELRLAAVLVEADGSRRRPVKAPTAHEPVIPAETTLLVPVLGLDGLGHCIDEQYVHRPEQVHRVLGTSAAAQSRLAPAMAVHLLASPQGGAKALPAGARLLPLLNKADGPVQRAAARLIARTLTQHTLPCLIGTMGLDMAEPIYERWAPLAAVVLAAGRSSRMGRPKQLESVDGEPMVIRSARIALQSDAQRVLVVTGAYAAEVSQCLAELRQQAAGRLQLVHNPDWEKGQSSSVHAALRALPRYIGAAIFMPVDQPYVPPALLRRLQRRWQQGAALAAPAVEGSPRGAPALFDRSLWPALFDLGGDVGGRSLLQAHRADLATVAVPAAYLRDIDTPEDLLSEL
jgi:molybdenum cofactor cytidylyltransferase